MIPYKFDYYKPSTIDEACRILRENKNSMVLAGGTDLLIKIRDGSHRPDAVVDIKDINGMADIRWEQGCLFLGSAVTITDIKNDSGIKNNFPAMHEAASSFGCYEVRNRATIGGNICNASPGAEFGGPFAVYEAGVKISSGIKERVVPFSEFITAPSRTILEQGEIVTGILIPVPASGTKSAYKRAARVKGQDLATCAVTVLAINPDTACSREVRVGLSAVLKTPSRSADLEAILSGKEITGEIINNAKSWIKENIHPRASSLRGTPDFKREIMGSMLEILLRELNLTN